MADRDVVSMLNKMRMRLLAGYTGADGLLLVVGWRRQSLMFRSARKVCPGKIRFAAFCL
jgi:hypothetical protein